MKCTLKTNIFIDLAMFIAMVVTSLSGIVIRIIAPLRRTLTEGPIHDMASWFFKVWNRRTWGNIHLWAGVAVLLLLVVHLVCHWSVIDGFFKKYIGNAVARWTLYVVLMALLLLSVVPWLLAI